MLALSVCEALDLLLALALSLAPVQSPVLIQSLQVPALALACQVPDYLLAPDV